MKKIKTIKNYSNLKRRREREGKKERKKDRKKEQL